MSELIANFGIDWRLLLAQVVNFLILLWLLHKYAYGPILGILKKRKEEIAKGLEFTQIAEKRLANIEKEREEILTQARKEALVIFKKTEEEAKRRKEEMIKEASHKAEAVIAEAKRAVGEEKIKMREEIYQEAEEAVRLGIAKILGKMPAGERDGELIKEALRELKAIAELP